jgi:hypothetical protein
MNESMPSRVHPDHAAKNPVTCSADNFVRDSRSDGAPVVSMQPPEAADDLVERSNGLEAEASTIMQPAAGVYRSHAQPLLNKN